ncbi:GDP-mannose-dependent alpha-mannosyltransferase [Synechococcus sp. MIT S9509]|uniref:glycosyltransferase n=1 Tax=unclassified Synechococcus TaxID=2626047 RepID=UPI0007BB52E2|nr:MULTISPECIES: glycosyltransferase [unclassified Synechococcus]KZR84308.1 GDP-mannose-dependent alpha-mannosyltransferase [Synechococcus sp. MIT S9504]KZR89231.1 GDP-mannose-dependent alpha-mannosyltransferase [Synechococcus sp. MIT S9509]
MRILLAVHQFFPDFRAGTETLTRRTAEELQRRGHHVWILTAGPHKPGCPTWRRESWEGLELVRMNPPPEASPFLGGVAQSYWRPELEAGFIALLRDLQPELLHVFHLRRHTLTLVQAARRCRVPVFASLTDYWMVCPSGQLQFPDNYLARRFSPPLAFILLWLWRWLNPLLSLIPRSPFSALKRRPLLMAQAFEQFEQVLVPSQLMWRTFEEMGVSTHHFALCPYGISLEGLDVLPQRKPWAGPEQRSLRVGFIGSFNQAKGAHVLLEALALVGRHQSLQAVLYGNPADDPEYWQSLQRQADALPQVRFGGVFASEQVFEVLASLDVLVVPSLWRENSPLIVEQAKASGLPLLLSDVDGMADRVVSGVNAMLFPPGDSRRLAADLIQCVRDQGVLAAFVNRGGVPRTIADYGDQLEQIYARVIRR